MYYCKEHEAGIYHRTLGCAITNWLKYVVAKGPSAHDVKMMRSVCHLAGGIARESIVDQAKVLLGDRQLRRRVVGTIMDRPKNRSVLAFIRRFHATHRGGMWFIGQGHRYGLKARWVA